MILVSAFMTLKNQIGFSGVFISKDEALCHNCDEQKEKGHPLRRRDHINNCPCRLLGK